MGNTVGGLKSGMKTFQSCDKKERKENNYFCKQMAL